MKRPALRFLNSTSPDVQAVTIRVLGNGLSLRAESEAGEGVFGTSNGPSGTGVWGNNTAGGNGVIGTSDAGDGVGGASTSGTGVRGTSVSGVALHGEIREGPGLALQALGPVQFSTSLIATIPQGQTSVTVAPMTGHEEHPLDLTENTKVLCTLLQDAGPGRVIQYVSIDQDADTFTVHLTLAARASAAVACFVLN
jgi:hypothetical protein